MKIGVHITHEAVQKIGGIGSVITGLCTADSYKGFFDRTLLFGPLFSYSGNVFSRLGKGGEVLYSNLDNYDSADYHNTFMELISKYHIDIVYGKRTLVNEFNINKKNSVDTLLIGINSMNTIEVNLFKHRIWEMFGIESDQYADWDYEQYLRIAIPYPALLRLLYPDQSVVFHFSHEYMGIPSVLSILLADSGKEVHKTVFYAHEISPCRNVVETISGHDIAFYTTMHRNMKKGKSFEDEYGVQKSYRSALVKQSKGFDYIFAVGDIIKEEYQYLIPDVDVNKLKVVYNGIPLRYISHEEKRRSREQLRNYIGNLFNFDPDIIFTHVTRLVMSKGIWRDITFLYILDEIFHRYKIKGAYILLSTLIGTGRDSSEIAVMEREYGWPVIHREGWPDLVGAEKEIYAYLSLFNARSRNIKGIFLNQFGFDRRSCGERVPENAEFSDLRIGSDAEFGFSIYEPFGIAQLETLPFGGIAALSSSCGCASFIQKYLGSLSNSLFTIFDFINDTQYEREDLSHISTDKRFQLEKEHFQKNAEMFFSILPKDDTGRLRLLDEIQENLECLGWENIAGAIDFSKL